MSASLSQLVWKFMPNWHWQQEVFLKRKSSYNASLSPEELITSSCPTQRFVSCLKPATGVCLPGLCQMPSPPDTALHLPAVFIRKRRCGMNWPFAWRITLYLTVILQLDFFFFTYPSYFRQLANAGKLLKIKLLEQNWTFMVKKGKPVSR